MSKRRLGIGILLIAVAVLGCLAAPSFWINTSEGEAPHRAQTGDVNGQEYLPEKVLYVSCSGNDRNPGTLEKPFKTIQKAADAAVPGCAVRIRGGTYYERVVVRHSGTKGLEITFQNYPGETPIIDGKGLKFSFGECLFDINGCDYIRVKGLRIQNSPSAGIGSAKGDSEKLLSYRQSSSYVTVENCHTFNTGLSGIHFRCSNHIAVIGNVIEKANTAMDQEALTLDCVEHFEIALNEIVNQCKEGINLKVGCRYGTIHDNLIHDPLYIEKAYLEEPFYPFYTAVYVDGWKWKTHDIAIYSNEIHDMVNKLGDAGTAFILNCENLEGVGEREDPDIYNILIHDNRIRNISSALILSNGYVNEGGHDPEYRNIIFENNACYQLRTRAIRFASAHAHDIHIVSNRFGLLKGTELVQIYTHEGELLMDPRTTHFIGNEISSEVTLIHPETWTTLSDVLGDTYSDNAFIGYD